MRTWAGVVVAVSALLVAGCSNKEQELQKQLQDTQTQRSNLEQSIADRDKYLEEVMQSINDVYSNLESVRLKEGKLQQRTGGAETPAQLTSAESRQNLLHEISDIGSTLKDDQKKIAGLQSRMRLSHRQIAGLDTLVESLKSTLAQREQAIAELQARVQGLDSTVAENTRVIALKDDMINDQQRRMNTGYYVIGKKDDLRKRGIIADEGGFLWGLLGSTTVMTTDADTTVFIPIDKTRDDDIHVNGKIDEILPHRSPDTFAMGDNGSDLKIVNPQKFWRENRLVIVVD